MFANGVLFESTGRYGYSELRRVELRSGRVLASRKLAADRFGEGLALLNNRLYQLTWKSGIAYTFPRPTGFMQNFLLYAGTIQSQGAFYGSGSEAPVGYIDVRDIAAVAARVLTSSGHENKIYELTGPEALSYSDVANKLAVALGKAVRYVPVPEPQARQGMIGSGMPEWTADAILDLQHFYDAGKAAAVSKDVERVTGRTPISFDKFARDFRDAFRAAVAS